MLKGKSVIELTDIHTGKKECFITALHLMVPLEMIGCCRLRKTSWAAYPTIRNTTGAEHRTARNPA